MTASTYDPGSPAVGVPTAAYLDALPAAGATFAGVGTFPVEEEVARLRRLVPPQVDEVPFDRLLPVLDLSERGFYHWATRAAVVAVAARRAMAATGRPVPVLVHDGDYEVRGRVVVAGTLDVRGRLDLDEDAELVVLGDVRASDVVESADAVTFGCGGDVTVDGVVSTGGVFVTAGSLTAQVTLAYFNQGFLIVGGDLRSTVLYESDHGGSVVLGAAYTEVAMIDEMRGVPYDDAAGDRLLDLVRPELVDEVRALLDDDEYRDLEDLLSDHGLARTLLR